MVVLFMYIERFLVRRRGNEGVRFFVVWLLGRGYVGVELLVRVFDIVYLEVYVIVYISVILYKKISI